MWVADHAGPLFFTSARRFSGKRVCRNAVGSRIFGEIVVSSNKFPQKCDAGSTPPEIFWEKWLACSAFLVNSRSKCACDYARSVIFGHRAFRSSNPSRIFGSVAPRAPLCSRILGETARRGVARSTIFGKSAQRALLRSGIFGQNGCLWPFYPRNVVQIARRGPVRSRILGKSARRGPARSRILGEMVFEGSSFKI